MSVGLQRNDKHFYRWNDGPWWPGVTSISDAADDKSGLINWAKSETAACAVRNYDFVADLIARGGPDGAIKWLSGIPDYKRDTAADMGTKVHILAEQIARGANPDVPDEQRPFVEAYRRFLDEYRPVFETVEAMVVNQTVGYGGTLDAIAFIGGQRYLLDIKTSRTVQPKTACQLAAYGNAEWVGRPNDPRKYGAAKLGLERFDGFAVLHVRPEQYESGYRLVPFRVTEKEWDAFLHAKALSEWRKSARSIIGESVPAPAMEDKAA